MKIQVICIQKTRNLHPSYKFIKEDINVEPVINRIKGRTWKMVWVSTLHRGEEPLEHRLVTGQSSFVLPINKRRGGKNKERLQGLKSNIHWAVEGCKVKRKLFYIEFLAVWEFSAVQRQGIHSGNSMYICIMVPSFVWHEQKRKQVPWEKKWNTRILYWEIAVHAHKYHGHTKKYLPSAWIVIYYHEETAPFMISFWH